ncbi:hypothetical protein GCM10009552_23960 [Rothia nasimurium]|uniref:CBM-cenC domain-containing protein n=1 Tax=Luteibacter anthropi TaxID=564369 RepID=A0A7X5ZI79_9GAMM|nr:hypothetical protein [Luteibacter anthropi]NII06441.1 hypothetical protein [Luteibacter anthropi]
MQFSRVDFRPIASSGDDVTAALKKLDLNFGDLQSALSDSGEIGARQIQLEAKMNRLATSMSAYRNRLINGNFDFWQRGSLGTVPASSSRFLADRWRVRTVESKVDVARVPLGVWAPVFPGCGRYAFRATVSSAGTQSSYAVLAQAVEDAATLAGGKVTLSFWAYVSSPAGIGVELVQSNGGNVTTGIGSRKFVASTVGTWSRYATTIDVPALSAPEGSGDNLQVIIWLDAGSDFAARSGGVGNQSATICISQIQLETGDQLTSFERRPYAIEQQLCERYFQKSFDIDQPPVSTISAQPRANMVYADTGVVASVPLRVRMRVPPALTFWGSSTVPSSGNNWVILSGTGWQAGQTAPFIVTESEFSCTTIFPPGGFNTIKSIYVQGSWTADAEL